ncbi:AAA domain-containing protein [Saccharopolyspora sp. NPDC002376]
MFSPQKVDKVAREQDVFAVRPDQLLPWDPDHELARRRLRSDQVWQHVVYLGIYQLDKVFEVLSRVFEPDADSYDERPAGESAIAAFLVGEDGRAILDSEVLSSCAWATGKVFQEAAGSRDLLADFQDATLDFGEALRDVVTDEHSSPQGAPSKQVPRMLDADDLAECLASAVAAAGTDAALPTTEIRISSRAVSQRKADAVASHDFLNSHIMNDLALVAERTAKGDIGTALHEYLRPEAEIPTTRRIDVRERIDTALAATSPDAVPAGRWPSLPEHALALNQQLAVSTAVSMPGDGLMGVNGPPGTGKTTMLRDLIAALVVERAELLASLSSPQKAFTGEQMRWATGQYTRVISEWRPELTGFEIVVASANNGAVQNVTDEIPAADAIDESWQEQAAALDYFPAIATALLAPDSEAKNRQSADEPVSHDGWAAIAARLGNKGNRSRFTNAFWFHKPDERADDNPWFGLLTILKNYEQTAPEQSWADAVGAFRDTSKKVETLRSERSAVYRTVERRAQVEAELVDLRSSVSEAVGLVEAAKQRRDTAVLVERQQLDEADRFARARRAEAEQAARRRRDDAARVLHERQAAAERNGQGRSVENGHTIRSWEAELGRRWQVHAQHQQSRPGFWEQLLTFGGAGKRWLQQDVWLTTEVRSAEQKLHDAQQEVTAAQREVEAARRAVVDAKKELDAAEHVLEVGVPTPVVTYEPLVAARRDVALAEQEIASAASAQAEAEAALRGGESQLARLDDQLDQAAGFLGRHYPDETWWNDRERRELAALWTDPEWNTARSELFLAALALHKAFLQHAPTEMRRNLQAAMDVVGGGAPSDAPEEAVLAAWQSLFFVVPVVSTTFASYSRLFSHLGKEALGWLLIDEAGQATPQNAVGALWRTQRAIVVGDPLQLEPITTLPFRAEQAIRNEHDVDEQWSPSRTSVQRIADRLTPLGTELPDDDGMTWVGVPLTVHRRCDQPMFDIVNAVAYDGLMINGTGSAAGERFETAYPTLPESKWIDVASSNAQGHWIPDEGKQLDHILGVLAGLDFDMSGVMAIGPFRDIARQLAARSRRHPGLVAGTVHTAQGKQADIVIAVLGSKPDSPGARRWAASKPNLLNVAVSRAKRRLYVIGDRSAWSVQRHFDVLAANLPHATPRLPDR